MVLLLVFMQLTRDLFAIAKFLLSYTADKQTDKQTDSKILPMPTDRVGMGNKIKITIDRMRMEQVDVSDIWVIKCQQLDIVKERDPL